MEDCIPKRSDYPFDSLSAGRGVEFGDRPSKLDASTRKNCETLDSKIAKGLMNLVFEKEIQEAEALQEKLYLPMFTRRKIAHMIYVFFNNLLEK